MTLLSKNAELVGFRLALLAIVCWSSAFLVARFLLGGDARVDPVSLVFYRFLIGSAAILGYAAWRKESLRFRSLREFMQMLAVAFFMLFLMSLLFSSASRPRAQSQPHCFWNPVRRLSQSCGN